MARDLALTPHAGDFVRSVVVADYPAEGDAVEALRRAILCEYADTVFNPEVERPPPVRGPMGEATITLKPGAVPIKQRMFQMHGERKDKWAELVTELGREGKVYARLRC